MGKRFGRNQRKKLRDELEASRRQHQEAARNYSDAFRRASRLQMQLNEAVGIAFERFVEQQGLMKVYVEAIGRELGKEAQPHFEKFVRELRPDRQPTLTAGLMPHGQERVPVRVITGRIPSFEYRYAILEA